jgi:methylmalonyl-CoA/ethylmalonyl-CoA epimerase
MHDTPIRVDHVGIAVESVADAEPVLLALGCEKLHDDTLEGRFRWVYYRLGDASRLELIEPLGDESFLTDFLDRHGPGLHHVTLEVADLDAVVETLEDQGLDVVDYRTVDGWTEAFVSPRNPTGALFQLMEYHDPYVESVDRPAEEVFVNGHRLE